MLPDSIAVEESGCLSMCAAGPNLCVKQGDKSVLLYEIDTAHAAIASLKILDETLSVHPKLLAAWSCVEKSYKERTIVGKEKYLDSVVDSLQKTPELVKSKAMAHALVLRAQVRLDDGRLSLAKDDALLASSIDPNHSTVWRVLANIEEANHNIPKAIEALLKWAEESPLFKSKAYNEIERLKMAY